LHGKTSKQKQMLHCKINFSMFCANWTSGETDCPAVPALQKLTVLQFQHSTCINFLGTFSRCFIIWSKSSRERRFELGISGQFNTKAVNSQQFRLTPRTVPFCDYSEVQAKYRLNITLPVTIRKTSLNIFTYKQ